jgi:hypothetical protein
MEFQTPNSMAQQQQMNKVFLSWSDFFAHNQSETKATHP